MGKEEKKHSFKIETLPEEQKRYISTLDNDPEYSLEVDPTNLYEFDDRCKIFIKNFIDLKNLDLAAEMANISREESIDLFNSYAFKQEVARINRAIYHRTFANKLLTIDEIGGYLTSVLTNQVPVSEQLTGKDKVNVAKMIIDLNKMKLDAFEKPEIIDIDAINEKLNSLNTSDIKKLISNEEKKDEALSEKKQLIEMISNKFKITQEEKKSLETLDIKQLKELYEIEGNK